MQIYDRYNGGDRVMDRLASKLKGGCEFLTVVKGRIARTIRGLPAYYLRSSPSGKSFGQKADSVHAKVAVIVEEPKVNERRSNAILLIEAYEKSGGNPIDMIHMLGELMEEPIHEQKPGQRSTRRRADEPK